MLPVKLLGCLIDDLSSFDKYIEASEDLPEILSVNAFRPLYPYWMRYTAGELLFSMNLDCHPIMAEMIDRTEIILRKVLPESHKVERAAIQLLKTTGIVKSHCDLTRHCAINIGLRNSSSAITRIGTSDDNTYPGFKANHMEYTIVDGHGYLFNTKQRHSVIGSAVPRYLISYGMRIPYQNLVDDMVC